MKKSQLQKKISGWDKNVNNLSTQLDDLKYKFSSVSREKRSVETSNTISNKKRQELEKKVYQQETEVVRGYKQYIIEVNKYLGSWWRSLVFKKH